MVVLASLARKSYLFDPVFTLLTLKTRNFLLIIGNDVYDFYRA